MSDGKIQFEGTHYRLPDNWFKLVPLQEFSGRPINYLEVGVFYGANLLSVCETYAVHPDSRVHGVDPWEDYELYPEYRGQQDSIYATFQRNVQRYPGSGKVSVHRGYSHAVLPRLPDDHFDIVYVDANHEPEFAMEDAVLAFRKLKVGGYLILDDYGWGGPDHTQRGLDGFRYGYANRLRLVGLENTQLFLQRTK